MSPRTPGRFSAGGKLVAAVGLVLVTALLPASRPQLLLAPAGLLLLAGLLARVRWLEIIKRLLWLEPFVLGVAVLALFQPGGWRLALVLLAKSSLCLVAMILLSATTAMTDLLEAMRRARVPGLFITTIALTYRYLFVLRDESQRMQRARLSRLFVPGRQRMWRSLGHIAGQLFVRSSERAERIYAAMCARGWR